MLYRLIFTSVFFSMLSVVSNPLIAMDLKDSSLPAAPGGPTIEKVKATLGNESEKVKKATCDTSACEDVKATAQCDEKAVIQSRAYIYRFTDGGNIFDPSGMGARFYPEFRTGGKYHNFSAPADCRIHFDRPVSTVFLERFLQFMNERNIENHKTMGRYYQKLKSKVLRAEELFFQAFMSQEEFQKVLDEVNRHFNQ